MRARRHPALGGNGYINDYPTGRLLRDAKLYEIGAGTSEIRRMLIGRELFDKTALASHRGKDGTGSVAFSSNGLFRPS
jgi:hypothetical protein